MAGFGEVRVVVVVVVVVVVGGEVHGGRVWLVADYVGRHDDVTRWSRGGVTSPG